MELVSLRDQPNTQREYETIFIVVPDADSEQIQQINDRIRKVIEKESGKLLRVENWGKRKLAYEIRKQTRGIYLYWRYLSPASLVHEIERNLRMLDPVIRYMTVKIDEDVDPDARPTDMDDEAFVQASQTIPDEEDIALGRIDREGDPEDDLKDEGDDDARASGGRKDEEPTTASEAEEPRSPEGDGQDPDEESDA